MVERDYTVYSDVATEYPTGRQELKSSIAELKSKGAEWIRAENERGVEVYYWSC